MNDSFSAGSHLISTATVFGAAALAFSIFPFGIVLLRAFLKAKESTTSGFSILGSVMLAFAVHFMACVLFMAIIKILDIAYTSILEEDHYITNKLFRIFWASDRNAVFALSGGGATNDALGAYSILLLVQTIGRAVLYNMPLLVIVVGIGYGVYQANKDNYKQDYLGVIVFSMVSFIAVSTIYVAWAYIASLALFLPDGKNLFFAIHQYWQSQLLK